MGRAFGYVRGSTDKQTLTIEAQRTRIEAYAVTRELGEVIFFSDPGVSASKTPFAEREAGAGVLKVLRPGDHLIITKIDRGFRNLIDFLTWFEYLIDRDIYLHVVDFGGSTVDPRSSVGRLVFRVIATIAEFESETRGERVKATADYLKSIGRLQAGEAPSGFKLVKDGGKGRGRIVPDPKARAIMARVLEARETSPTLFAASIKLNREKCPFLNPRQERWHPMVVSVMSRRELALRAKERNGETHE